MTNLRVAVINPKVIDILTGGADQWNPQIVVARRRAMNKVMNFANGLVKKSLAAQTGLPQKAFKGRVIVSVDDDGSEGLVWIGAYRVSPYGISPKVLQTKRGILAGRTSFPGAFKPFLDKPDKRVFIRKASKHFDAERYTKKAFGQGKGYPVVAVAEDIELAADQAIDLSSKEIEDRFETVFQQELNFAMEHEK